MRNLLVALTVLLAGCNSLSYQEPTQGARARVRFVTTSGAPTVLRVYDDANCTQNETEWMRLKMGDSIMRGDLKTLGMPLWKHDKNAAKEVYVDASKKLHGMFFGGDQIGKTVYSCGVPFSFTFSEHNDYEVKFHWAPHQCWVTVSQIVPNGSTWSLTYLKTFDSYTNASNRGCLSQFKRARLPGS
jgi:hypothetical protein